MCSEVCNTARALCQFRSGRREEMSQAPVFEPGLCGVEAAPERFRLYVVRAHALAVDLHHRDQLPVLRLQLGVVVDRHLLELEPELDAKLAQLLLGSLAKMTAGRLVEDDPSGRRARRNRVCASAPRCSPPGSVLSRAHIYGYGRSLRPPQGTTIAARRRAPFRRALLRVEATRDRGVGDPAHREAVGGEPHAHLALL